MDFLLEKGWFLIMSTGMWIKPLEKWMQCVDTFGWSYTEGEMRMCFGVLLGESGSTRQQGQHHKYPNVKSSLFVGNLEKQHLHCHHGMWVTQCQVTMSAAGSLSLHITQGLLNRFPVLFFLSHWKGGLWRQRVHRIVRLFFLTAKIWKLQNLPFLGKKSPQSQQQNQRRKRCWNIAFVAPARRNAPEVELFWLEGNTKAQPPRVRSFPKRPKNKTLWTNVHASEILKKIQTWTCEIEVSTWIHGYFPALSPEKTPI